MKQTSSISHMKNYLLILAFLFISTVSFSQGGRMAPEIKLPDANGDTVRLSSLRGKVVLIDFWASWCGPCRRSNKHMRSIYTKYKDKGFEILGISTDDSKNDWKRAVKEDKITWLQVIDVLNVAYAWHVSYLPTTYLIDKKGRIAAVDPDPNDIERLVKEYVSQ
jgi:peroxiredoxin